MQIRSRQTCNHSTGFADGIFGGGIMRCARGTSSRGLLCISAFAPTLEKYGAPCGSSRILAVDERALADACWLTELGYEVVGRAWFVRDALDLVGSKAVRFRSGKSVIGKLLR